MRRNDNSDVYVIIPTYNSIKTLLKCLESIYRQTLKPKQIIVVDNASTDQTSQKIKKEYPWVKLITLKKNLGVSGGRNTGIKVVGKKTGYILFFDHDMYAKKDLLENLVRVCRTDGDIGIVTPKIYYWEDRKRIWSAGTGINLLTGQVIFRGGKDQGQFQKDEEVQVAPAVMLVKTIIIKQIGGFDERYFATFEDTDFCFRAKDKGYKTYFAHKAVAYHDLSTNRRAEMERLLSRAFYVGRNRVLFMRDFGKSLLVFFFFLPVYIIYFCYMGIREKNIKAVFEFIRGTIIGLYQ